MHIDFPYDFDRRGRTAETDYLDHVRDMLEQVLFTSPGERVNRPDFGCGLLQLIQETNSPELAETVKLSVQGSLDRWLGNVIEVADLQVESVDATLSVFLTYRLRRTGDLIEKELFELEPQV
jgi:phage baseplate assembly protein W